MCIRDSSHTVLDYPKLLKIGARGIIGEIRRELEKDQAADRLKKDTLEAMILCYEGLIAYARNLSAQAAAEAREEADERRKAELERLAEICARVPENPCTTLDEALNAIWTVSYTHLRAHETVLDIVCRLLHEKKKKKTNIHSL